MIYRGFLAVLFMCAGLFSWSHSAAQTRTDPQKSEFYAYGPTEDVKADMTALARRTSGALPLYDVPPGDVMSEMSDLVISLEVACTPHTSILMVMLDHETDDVAQAEAKEKVRHMQRLFPDQTRLDQPGCRISFVNEGGQPPQTLTPSTRHLLEMIMQSGGTDYDRYEEVLAFYENPLTGESAQSRPRMVQTQTPPTNPVNTSSPFVSTPSKPVAVSANASRSQSITANLPDISVKTSTVRDAQKSLKDASKGEPDLHEAIMRGNLRKFRKSLSDPAMKSRRPRNMPAYVRVLTSEVQNGVDRETREAMLRELESLNAHQEKYSDKPGYFTQGSTLSHLFAYGPPTAVKRALLAEKAEREANGKEPLSWHRYLTSQFQVMLDFTESEFVKASYYDSHYSMYCNEVGATLIGLITSTPRSNGHVESRENLTAVLELYTPEEINSQPACYISSGAPVRWMHGEKYSPAALMVLLGNSHAKKDADGYKTGVLDAAVLLRDSGVMDASEIDTIERDLQPVFAEIRKDRGLAAQTAAIKAAINIDRREPDIHKALLRGDVAAVKRLAPSQAAMKSVSPPGMLPIQRFYTPDVLNTVGELDRLRMGAELYEYSQELKIQPWLTLIAAYGDADEFWRNYLTTSNIARNKGNSPMATRQYNLTTAQVGQSRYSQWGPTEHTCPIALHVYMSLSEAPQGSTQYEEALKKLEGLIFGRMRGVSYRTDGPDDVDRESGLMVNLDQTCFYYARNPNPLAFAQTLVTDKPSLYTMLGRDLADPNKKERAAKVIGILQKAGRYEEGRISRDLERSANIQSSYRSTINTHNQNMDAGIAYDKKVNDAMLSDAIQGAAYGLARDIEDINRQNNPDPYPEDWRRHLANSKAKQAATGGSGSGSADGSSGNIGPLTLKDGELDIPDYEGFEDDFDMEAFKADQRARDAENQRKYCMANYGNAECSGEQIFEGLDLSSGGGEGGPGGATIKND